MKLLYPLLLASNSPRRRQILTDAGFEFSVEVRPTSEAFPATMPVANVAAYLALQKALAFTHDPPQNRIVLTADTVVIIQNEILNKPQHVAEAKDMLRKLSGRKHTVMTGVCMLTPTETINFADTTHVTFKDLHENEIEYYISTCKPFDKAGAYGVQDFIGMVGITHIEGSFFTVMGLPIHRVYEELQRVNGDGISKNFLP